MTIGQGGNEETQLARLTRMAALGEPIRRLLYRFVAAQHDPVSRDQAAEGVGVARHVAKFHLDKLAEDGLLDTAYQRPPGRSGPGAGRPTKLYRPAQDEITVSLPERHYDLAADILAEAVTATQETGVPIREALRAAARQAGTRPAHSGDPTSPVDPVTALCDGLTARGYEPTITRSGDDQAAIMLSNCPFHRLATTHTDLICGLNLDLLSSLLDNTPGSGLSARLDPGPGRCCVTLAPISAATTR